MPFAFSPALGEKIVGDSASNGVAGACARTAATVYTTHIEALVDDISQDDYLNTVREVYREAALMPQAGLCCTTTPIWMLPDFIVPQRMLEMNYGCGSTVHLRDLALNPTVLYVGIGGGMELLQFAYFSRTSGAVIGIDSVAEMIDTCRRNLLEAEANNSWFNSEMVDLRLGDALKLPVEDETIDVAAQNCLFNIFHDTDLRCALQEMYRVLGKGHILTQNQPMSVCDKTAEALAALGRNDIYISGSTFFYDGGGCC